MATFVFDQLSANPTVQGVIRRMGLRGFALVVRFLEDCTDSGQLGMTAADWATFMQCSPDKVASTVESLTELGAIKATWSDDAQGLVMMSLGDRLRFLLAKPDPATVVFTRAAQWAEWMTCELGAPSRVTGDLHAQELFRRLCASNATLGEMNQAAECAALIPDVSPAGLFNAWKQVRAERVSQAYSRA